MGTFASSAVSHLPNPATSEPSFVFQTLLLLCSPFHQHTELCQPAVLPRRVSGSRLAASLGHLTTCKTWPTVALCLYFPREALHIVFFSPLRFLTNWKLYNIHRSPMCTQALNMHLCTSCSSCLPVTQQPQPVPTKAKCFPGSLRSQ